ncbi:putative translation elongation factor eEF-1B gamma subunit [Zopfia rhizophila CBS 207.26]|uniref:Putative translation elongation factor eEF-1B gamma subunit n=1 Tax=Zopfia rhizophila CBS 207.26 TaxID=1314779 RepID=A0A6A6DKN5_9PEZI|nr:putative translation elongation factor eEF-1B gamma subunit [Zopfia rhizophila CBS 207.26]
MPPFATLYTTTIFLHPRTVPILAAANLNSLEIALSKDFEYGVTNKTPEYVSKFPMGKIPALETPSGFYLAEATAIAKYVSDSGPAREQLLGRTAEEKALVHMWISLNDTEIFPSISAILGPIFRGSKYIKEVVDEKEEMLVRALKRVELHLQSHKWLVRDDEFSLADLSIAGTLYFPLTMLMDAEYRAEYPRVMEWWERLVGLPEVRKAFANPKTGEVSIEYCEKRPPPEGLEHLRLPKKL